jgi:hypothetical protein
MQSSARHSTPSEAFLHSLCRRSFLSLWSYTNLFRDQGKTPARGHGKELCDLLVVFGDQALIFSDKNCSFPNKSDLAADWSRWFRRAIWKSAVQAWGAARWITSFPHRIYTDRSCTTPIPIELPPSGHLDTHLIVVAHDSARRCRETLGGSGSLMIAPLMVGRDHFDPQRPNFAPFSIGVL